MNETSFDIAEYLEDQGSLSLTYGTNLFTNREPAKPDRSTTIFDTPDRGPQLLYDNTGGQYEYNAIQIRIRDRDSNRGFTLANDIKDILHGLGNFTFNGARYTLIEALDSPFLLDWDENNRAHILTNYHIQRNPA